MKSLDGGALFTRHAFKKANAPNFLDKSRNSSEGYEDIGLNQPLASD
jgi:hypothetical protein